MQIEEHNKLIRLFDLYGSLLSKKQYDVMDKFLNFDLGESELGKEFGGTRQSVHDAITKAKKQLLLLEQKCKFEEIMQNLKLELMEIEKSIGKDNEKASQKIKNIIKDM